VFFFLFRSPRFGLTPWSTVFMVVPVVLKACLAGGLKLFEGKLSSA
jgi:hypothetical protein